MRVAPPSQPRSSPDEGWARLAQRLVVGPPAAQQTGRQRPLRRRRPALPQRSAATSAGSRVDPVFLLDSTYVVRIGAREGCHTSPSSRARRFAFSELPPTHISGVATTVVPRLPRGTTSAVRRSRARRSRARDQADRLVAAPATTPEFDTHDLELIFAPAHSDTECEAAAKELLQGRYLFREGAWGCGAGQQRRRCRARFVPSSRGSNQA
jgi:hypothetical protein